MAKKNKVLIIDLTESLISKIMSLQGTLEFSSDATMGIQLKHSNGETTVEIAPRIKVIRK